MCYSPAMSATFAILGAYLTYRLYNIRDKTRFLWVLFLFYTLMEVLQFAQFDSVNKCGDPTNRALTFVAFIFILAQPLLWNWYGYKENAKNEFQRGAFMVGFILSICLVIGLVLKYGGHKKGDPDDVLTGPLCTKKESSGHLYWKIPFSRFDALSPSFFMWVAIIAVPMLMVDNGLMKAGSFLLGMTIAYAISKTKDEFPSVWCLMALPLLAIGYIESIYGNKLKFS